MKKIESIFIIIVIIISTVTAWKSTGFYHADEHYQLIEFSGFKLGTHTESELAWEFKNQMRPAFQVSIAYLVIKTSIYFHVSDPYIQSFILRFLSLLLSIGAIVFFLRKLSSFLGLSPVSKLLLHVCTLGLWFVPFLIVRFSSESWSGLFFILGLAFVFETSRSPRSFFLLGFCFGISFLCRYQIALAIIPVVLYLIPDFIKDRLTLLNIFLGFLIVGIAGILIDYWYYGNFVLTSWTYFYKTLIENASPSFGEEGAWYYLYVILNHPTWYLGILFFASLLILLIKNPKNLLPWIVIIFVAAHSLIGHKEERFLFPLALLFGPILFFAIKEICHLLKKEQFKKVIATIAVVVFVSGNAVGWVIMASTGAGLGRMEITKFFHDRSAEKNKIKMYHTSWSNPFNPWGSIPIKFYQEVNVEEIHVENIDAIRQIRNSPIDDSEIYLVVRKIDLANPEIDQFLKEGDFNLVQQSVPEWLIPINRMHGYLDLNGVLLLYKFNK